MTVCLELRARLKSIWLLNESDLVLQVQQLGCWQGHYSVCWLIAQSLSQWKITNPAAGAG